MSVPAAGSVMELRTDTEEDKTCVTITKMVVPPAPDVVEQHIPSVELPPDMVVDTMLVPRVTVEVAVTVVEAMVVLLA